MDRTCNNCGAIFTSPYCPSCGQKADVGRLTLHSLLHEVWHGFTHTDKGILRLWTDLLLRPSQAYHNYFKGKRKSYFSPVVFFLLSFALYTFCDQKVFDYQDHVTLVKTGRLYNNEVGRYMQEHMKYMALTLLPLQALLTLGFYYKRANLAECIVFWLFCVGFINTLLILVTPVRILLIEHKSMVEYILSLLIMVIYVIHLVAAFGKYFFSFIKSILIVVIVSMLSTYISFYYLNRYIKVPFPTLKQAFGITFAKKSVVYMNGKTTIQ